MNANFSAHIGARITEFMAQMRQVQATIRTTANDVRVDVGADVSEFNRRMAEIRARIAALVRERVIIRIETRIQEFQNSINRIATNIRAFGELAQHTIQGTMISLLPAVVPLISNIGVAIANLGPMIGTVAGSTFALVGAFAAAGAGAVAFGAVAIPTIKKLFEETGKLTAQQASAKASFDAFKSTYDGLVKATEQPVLSAFQGAMTAANTVLKALQPLFVSSAQAVDGLMKSLNQSIGTPPVQAFLQYLNNSGASMLTTFGQAFGNVFKGLGSMLVAFAPLSASTAQGFLEMTQRFAEWANGLSASAKFQAFIDYVNTNMPKVRAIFRDAIAGIVYFFSAFAGSSQGMMDGLVNMMARFKEWSRTLSENQGFQQFVGYVQQTAPSVMALIGNLTTFLVNLGIGMAPLGAAIVVLVNKFLAFTNSLMENNRAIGVLIAGLISFGGVMLAVVPNLVAFSVFFKDIGPLMNGFKGIVTNIVPKLITFASAITNTTNVGRALGVAIGLITSPVGLVIAAIVALTAVFVALYKTNDTFRAQVQEVWSVIQKAISVSVNAIKDVVMNVWNQITSFWNQNQESIKATASTVWNVIGNVVTTVMSAIGAIMQAVWPVVKTIIVSTWEAIKNVIEGATKVILGIVKTFTSLFEGDWKGVWEGIKSILSGALQAVWGAINLYFVGKLLAPIKGFATAGKSVIQAAWEAIKSIFTNTLNAIKTLVSTVFNGIKNTITTIWNGIKSFISTILNAIKSTMSTIWQSIRNTLDQVLTSIRGLITSIWNGIKSTITTVLNGIKSVVSSVWNSIKSVVSSVVNGIKDTITTIWNGIKDVISTTMSTIKSTIETKWNEAKAFLTSINLLSVGKDIIAGLISGITSKFGEVASALSSLTDKIPSWVKSALGIHSPSRVMADIAQWIPIGMAKGIRDNTTPVKNSMLELSDILVSEMNATKVELEAIAKAEAAQIAKIEDDKAYNIKQINLKAQAAKRALTASELAKIEKLEKDASANILKTQESHYDKAEKILAKSEGERLKTIEDFVKQKRELEQLSSIEEAKIWEASVKTFTDGTQEKIKAQTAYKNALDSISTELTSINENYAKRVEEINKNLIDNEEKVTQEYEKALSERERALVSFTGIFDEFDVKVEKSGAELLSNLESQVKGFKQWQEEVAKLSERAIDGGLLAELKGMGPKALGELKALNSLSDTELTKYSDLYKEKSALARTQAEEELSGMKDDTARQIDEMREVAKTELSKLQNEWVSEIQGLTNQTASTLSSLEQIGRDAVAGLMNGMQSMHAELESTVKSIAGTVENTTRDVLDTHSPSKVMYDVGTDVVDGLVEGLADGESKIKGASGELGNWLIPKVPAEKLQSSLKSLNVYQSKIIATMEAAEKKKLEISDKYGSELLILEAKRALALAEYSKVVNDEPYRVYLHNQAYAAYAEADELLRKTLDLRKADSESLDGLLKEKFNLEKEYMQKRKDLNSITLADEIVAYKQFATQYAENSEERIYYDQKVAESIDKIADKEYELTKAYEDALESKTQSIKSFAGLFDEVTIKSDVSSAQLLANLQSQVDALEEWSKDFQELSNKAIDQGLLAELQAMGPKAQGEIKALNSMTESQLTQYVDLWKAKSEAARKQAEFELKGMKDDNEKQIADMNKAAKLELSDYVDIWGKSINEVTKELSGNLDVMESIGSDAVEGLIDGLNSKRSDLIYAAKALANTVADSMQTALEIHSPSRLMRDLIGKNIVEGVIVGMNDMKGYAVKAADAAAQWFIPKVDQAQLNSNLTLFQNYHDKMLKASEMSLEERFKLEKEYMNARKKFNTISLADELKAYEEFLTKYEVGTEERIHYEEKIAETKQAIHDKLIELNDKYLDKMQTTNQKLIDGELALNNAYTVALNSRTKDLYSFAGIFDEIKEKSDVSGQQLISNLRGQVDTFKDWSANIASLANKGIDKGLLGELQAMGPSAVSEIAALNGLTKDQLVEYTALWQEKTELARTKATAELEGLKEETAVKIEELRKETAKQLEIYQKEWQTSIAQVKDNTTNQFNAMVSTMPQVGANVIKGMQQGLSSMTPALLAQANAIAEAIKSTIQSALDIHSPSRWGKKMIGHNLVKGIILGFADMKSDAVRAAKELAEWVQPSVDVSDIINDISGAIDTIQTEIEHKVKVNVEIDGQAGKVGTGGGVHQEVHLHSPKHLSPSENARQLKRVAQQLAWE